MVPIMAGLVFVAVEACILVFAANTLLEKRFHPAIIYAIFIGVQIIRYFLANGEVWPGVALNIIALILLLIICYRSNITQKGSLLITYCAITMSCEIVIAVLVSLAFGKSLTFEEPVAVYTAYALHKVVLLVLAFLFLKIFKKGFSIRGWLKYFPIPLGLFVALHLFIDIWFENSKMFGPIIAL